MNCVGWCTKTLKCFKMLQNVKTVAPYPRSPLTVITYFSYIHKFLKKKIPWRVWITIPIGLYNLLPGIVKDCFRAILGRRYHFVDVCYRILHFTLSWYSRRYCRQLFSFLKKVNMDEKRAGTQDAPIKTVVIYYLKIEKKYARLWLECRNVSMGHKHPYLSIL